MENEDIWNFHGSLTLNNGKLIGYSGSLSYAIVSNMTHFYHNALFSVLKVKVLFQPDEYPAGWCLLEIASRIFGCNNTFTCDAENKAS